MSNGRVIASAGDIDLTRHGVIEAHAGTGKTYTIVELVLRMLELSSGFGKGGVRYVHLRNILLVTYTEKAAGELKKRIREGISARIVELRAAAKSRVLTAHFEDCLNNMHEAFIGTIHSVCLRLLQTWPFETGAHFNITHIENDADGAEAALRASIRTDWEDAATGLPQGLATMERHGMRFQKKHTDPITQTALKKYTGLIIQTALEIICNDGAELDLTPAGGLTLEEAIEKIDAADETETAPARTKLLYAFINRAALILADKYGAYKRENGLVSYDDMLRLMRDAVYSEDGAMLARLRRRLRYGIIDEFQDTSPIQWDIFSKIFLGNDDETGGREAGNKLMLSSTDTSTSVSTHINTRIYVVGDPKQSIYSFQGADINSYVSAKSAITSLGGTVYSLVNNYRSLPEMIGAYNAILCGDDWFLFGAGGDISYPVSNAACPPPRGAPPRPLAHKAVQIVIADGDTVGDSRGLVADAACAAIKKLVGTTISIPKGPEWENKTLNYGDFAVIIETHVITAPFIDAFRKRGIPCVKYKMSGVFKSAIARDLIALLSAIHRRLERPRRAAALLTHFFNRPAESITPETDTDYCPNRHCAGDNLCVAHALDAWGNLADKQLWAQLFRNIVEKTGIRRRLIRLADGERMLADLRQVTDYCVEYLYGQNSNIDNLIKHLQRLYDDEEEAHGDKNLHTLATEKSSVKILTMHASKGLEFPVVFLMSNDAAAMPKSPNILRWVNANKKSYFTPYIAIDDLREGNGKAKKDLEPLTRYKESRDRERKRLLYVAMTRPQAMLFIPMRKESKTDIDVTPRLDELLTRGDPNMEIFDGEAWDKSARSTNAPDIGDAQETPLDDIPVLSLQKFIGVETSYSQIGRQIETTSRDNDLPGLAIDDDGDDVTRNDEHHVEDIDIDTITEDAGIDTGNIGTSTNNLCVNPGKNQPLPGGKTTGDALHKAIEELMRLDDINSVINDNYALDILVERHLKRGGILDHPSTTDPSVAVKQASSYIKTALTFPYPNPNGDAGIVISAIPKPDRIPEMEFLLSCDPKTNYPQQTGYDAASAYEDSRNAWENINQTIADANGLPAAAPYRIRGFIDLVFRLKNSACPAHPYKYYFVDWKSDTLTSYDAETMRRYCVDRHYLLQSQIYTRALDKYLGGILGKRYDRGQHLGGALYVFLRGGTGVLL